MMSLHKSRQVPENREGNASVSDSFTESKIVWISSTGRWQFLSSRRTSLSQKYLLVVSSLGNPKEK